MTLSDDITALSGVTARRAGLLRKLNIHTPGDLALHAPRRYEDRRDVRTLFSLMDGETAMIRATVAAPPQFSRTGSGTCVKVRVTDDSGMATLLWWGAPYMMKKIVQGDAYYVYGKVNVVGRDRRFMSPQIEPVDGVKFMGRVLPTYPLTAGLTQSTLRNLTLKLTESIADGTIEIADALPDAVRERYGLMPLADAYAALHYPDAPERAAIARERLVFDELVGFLRAIHDNAAPKVENGMPLPSYAMLRPFVQSLPFKLTRSQIGAIDEIRRDLLGAVPMQRLLQGDVGSGKTVVAAAAMLQAYENGAQSVLMAPTEILANQHYAGLCKLFASYDAQIVLLTGGVSDKARRAILDGLSDGSVHMAVGTHALIQPDVQFCNLALVITDEQHRFGVAQRDALVQKCGYPHTLSLSATPIPRTLALALYGHVSQSILRDKPAGRKLVKTYAVDGAYRERIRAFLLKRLRLGEQAYIVCSLVDENPDDEEKSEIRAATAYHTELSAYLEPYGYATALVHGRMKGADKDAAMRQFTDGAAHVLVSTTVIEVGVDNPNATLIIIENAERFGLATLHQLRGRVGRGDKQSYCICVSDSNGDVARQRLQYFTQTHDGFALAEMDMQTRGAGELLGTRQHGLPTLRIAELYGDAEMVVKAKEYVDSIYDNDLQ